MFATAEGTARYSRRFPALYGAGFYRTVLDLNVSSIGLGTYLGKADDETDRAYAEAIAAAAEGGINFIDTAINYRGQRSERAVGAALQRLQRDEIVVCTKAGFLTPGAAPESLRPEDVIGGTHSMAPQFLADQIERSRANLHTDAIDVLYLHNPETQLGFGPAERFYDRVRAAFGSLEGQVERGNIRYYGMATWDGFRKRAFDLRRVAAIAREEGGEEHHFRFVQLPFNLGMVEAYVDRPESVLDIAAQLGMAVVASATLAQSQLLAGMPDGVARLLPGLTPAQRAIQFTRSTPGIAVALVGMSRAEHVAENLGVAAVPPLDRETYARFYQ